MIFVIASVTDYFDGYLARAWQQQSALGRMLDPIADKLLVAVSILVLVADGMLDGWSIWAAIIVLMREIFVSGLREFLAELRVSVPVTRLAKWKTTMQLIAIAALLIAPALQGAQERHPDQSRPHLLLGDGDRDALYGLRLFPRRAEASREGQTMKVRYFAWVRERVGRAEEEIDLPPEVTSVADLMAWLAARDEGYAAAFAEPTRHPRGASTASTSSTTRRSPDAREVAFFPPMTGG